MELESLEMKNIPGEEYYEDGIRYVYSKPYGLDNAEKFLVYRPGIKIADLPEEFVLWLTAFVDVKTTETLPYYGIYNVSGKGGFVGYYD